MNSLNESFNSTIIRELERINTRTHYNIGAQSEEALSPIGAKYMMSLPLLWDKVSDRDIKMYADYDLIRKIPTSDNLKGISTTRKDERATRNNLPATVAHYQEDRSRSDVLSEIRKAVGVYSADKSIIEDETRRAAFKKFFEGIIEQWSENTKPTNVLSTIDKLGDISDLKPRLSDTVYNELSSIIEKYKENYQKIDENDTKVRELKQLSSLFDAKTVHQADVDSSLKLLSSLGVELYKFGELSKEDKQKDIKDKVDVIEAESKELAVPALNEIIRNRDDIFTSRENALSLKYPLKSEFIEACIKDGKLTEEDVAEISSAEGYLDKSSFLALKRSVLQRRWQIDRDAYSSSDVDNKTQVISDDIEQLSKYLKGKYREMVGGSSYNVYVSSTGQKVSQYSGKVQGEKEGTAGAYDLLNGLYRKLISVKSSEGSDNKSTSTSQETEIRKSIAKKIFESDNERKPLKIFVLTDSSFRILYVLSYYKPSSIPYVYKKSGNSSILYGWKYGEGFDKETLVRLYNRLRRDEKEDFEGHEFISDGRVDLNTIVNDDRISIAVVIEGTDQSNMDVVEEGTREVSKYIYGKFSKDIQGMTPHDGYTGSYDFDKGVVVLNKKENTEVSDELQAKQAEYDDLMNRLTKKLIKSDERKQIYVRLGELEDEIETLQKAAEQEGKNSDVSKNGVRKALEDKGLDVKTENGQLVIAVSNETEANALITALPKIIQEGDTTIDVRRIDDALDKIKDMNDLYYMFAYNEEATIDNIQKYQECAKKLFSLSDEDIKTIEKHIYDNRYVRPTTMQMYDTLFTHVLYWNNKKFAAYNSWDLDGSDEYTEILERMDSGLEDKTFAAIFKKSTKKLPPETMATNRKAMSAMIVNTIKEFVFDNEDGQSVMSYVNSIVDRAIDSINEFLSTRIGFLKLAFNEAPAGESLMKYFYGYNTVLGNRTRKAELRGGVSPEDAKNAQTRYERTKSYIEPEENKDNRKWFMDSMNKSISAMEKIKHEPKGSAKKVKFQYKDLWNEIAKERNTYNLPLSYLGDNSIFGTDTPTKEWQIIASTRAFLESIYRAIMTKGIIDDEKIKAIYKDFKDYVYDIVDALNNVAEFKFESTSDEEKCKVELKEKMLEALKVIYNGRYELVSNLNREYGLNLRNNI